MADPYAPTHRLTVQWPDRREVVLLRLEGCEDGYAYTAAEWARDDSASWERRDGVWWLDGSPVMEGHPDRRAAISVQVVRLPGI